MAENRHRHPQINLIEDAKRSVFDAIALARREPGLSLYKAAKRSRTTVKAIRRYAPDALEEHEGRLRVKATDQLQRKMLMLTSRGVITVTTLDSDTASVIASYWNAIRTYITTGDYESLVPFILRFIHVAEGDFEFLTHRPTINRLVRAGELYFQDLYGSPGGI
jgi:hypothetical protein